jgi:hypothetical protein
MKTITRTWPSNAPRGDVQAKCDYCGVRWRRSQLRMDRSGLLVCPDEGPGLDAVTLSEGNAALSRRRGPVPVPPGGGNYTTVANTPDPTHITTSEGAGLGPGFNDT